MTCIDILTSRTRSIQIFILARCTHQLLYWCTYTRPSTKPKFVDGCQVCMQLLSSKSSIRVVNHDYIETCTSGIKERIKTCMVIMNIPERKWPVPSPQKKLHHFDSRNKRAIVMTPHALLVMGDISILYRYCFVFLDIRSINLISKSWYFDTILHMIRNSLRWFIIIIIIMQFLTSKVTSKFSVCFHYSKC